VGEGNEREGRKGEGNRKRAGKRKQARTGGAGRRRLPDNMPREYITRYYNRPRRLAYHGMIVDGKSRTVLPVYKEVRYVVIVVVTRSWSTEYITYIHTVFGKILFESILSISTSTGTQKVIKILFKILFLKKYLKYFCKSKYCPNN